MAAAPSAYDYASYEYGYDPNAAATAAAAAAYPSYPGYEASASYSAPTAAYDGYAASGAYHAGAPPGPPYTTVDPYSGYPATAYTYPPAAAPTGPPSATAAQAAYPPSYSSSAAPGSYPYDSRHRTPPPPATSAASSTHYPGYDYASAAAPGTYSIPAGSAATYSPYKTAPGANGVAAPAPATAAVYPNYPPSAVPSPHGAYGVSPGSHLGAPLPPPPGHHVYGAPPPPAAAAAPGAPILSRRPDYYPPPQVAQPMQYVHHPPQSMPYRLPPRGGYQRELDEPGDENALLRHVVYITGLPKEIQNETLAEVFGATCGPIAPVDVRSPKPKIWVYKDRQTREGKGEATITFINPESAQAAINYYNGRELFGREIRVTLCPRRIYNMQKQNTPFNPGAAPVSTTTPISSMVKSVPTNNNNNTNTNTNSTNGTTTSTNASAPATSTAGSSTTSTSTTINTTPATATTTSALSTATSTTSASSSSTNTTTSTTTTNTVTGANPIATISSSTHGLPRQLNHSLIKIRQTPEQQRGLLPTPPMPYGAPMMGTALQRDGVRKELPRVALTRGNYANPAGVRPKPY